MAEWWLALALGLSLGYALSRMRQQSATAANETLAQPAVGDDASADLLQIIDTMKAPAMQSFTEFHHLDEVES